MERHECEYKVCSAPICIYCGMAIIVSRIPGPPRVLIVDITNNTLGFERQMLSDLLHKFKETGIDLASDDVVIARTDEEYAAVFDRGLNFNILLLVAHGAPDVSEVEASKVVIPGGRSNWYELASRSSGLSNKLVCLAVCHGFCQDAIDAFVSSGEFALALVAPNAKLSRTEVIEFFPRFFEELKESSLESIDPNHVRDAVGRQNQHSQDKMKIFSQAISS